MTSPDRRLTEGLGRIADRMPPAHLDPAQITRPRGHRRNTWRAVAIAATATVAAITIPVISIVIVNQTSSHIPPATTGSLTTSPTTSVASSEPTETTTSASPSLTTLPSPIGKVRIDTTTAPMGPAPGIPYIIGNNFEGVDLGLAADEQVAAFAPYPLMPGDHSTLLLMVRTSIGSKNPGMEARIVNAPPTVDLNRTSWPVPNASLVRRADGAIAYFAGMNELAFRSADGQVTRRWKLPDGAGSPVGILPDGSVVLLGYNQGWQTMLATPHGKVTPVTSLRAAVSVGPNGEIAEIPSTSMLTGCTTMHSSIDGRQLWKKCTNTPGPFSPNGNLLIGRPQNPEGLGDPTVSILDARTGKVLVEFVASEDYSSAILGAVWEDDTHLLAFVHLHKPDSWKVVRLGVDGSVELVDVGTLPPPINPQVMYVPPMTLETQP